ncbi:MAG: acyltransferase domain-containing protein [wastewater metagenome]|nr:acyltransferase domain-containing protein [Candidatus Loosdrechtia aerotolerans]
MKPVSGSIAIIGMSCIFPGAPNVQTYWQNIVSKVDAISDPPVGWGNEDVLGPDAMLKDRIYCKKGGYLKDLAQFNPLKYGIMPSTIEGGEPGHFLALRAAYEALSDAGYLDRPFNREQSTVIIGKGSHFSRGHTNVIQHCLIIDQTIQILKHLHPEYSQEKLEAIKNELRSSLPPLGMELVPGLTSNVITGRIANRLDLMGPNYVVDAACASALIAIETGIQNLLCKQCDMVIAGGIHSFASPPLLYCFSGINALSRRGQVRPFDKDADGILIGEGVGMVILKRLEDAERDNDRIYAIIKGIGVASDGRALGLLTPRLEGEVLALQRAYKVAGVSPDTIGFIEAHGTGIPLGDITEIKALNGVFAPRNGPYSLCAVGSVKSMIGHLITAAGIAGFIKTALALYHKTLPPSLNYDEANPKLELEKTPFYINTETRPWIHGKPEPRRAGVSAFGFGGINAHAVLEEYTKINEDSAPSLIHTWDTEVFIIQGDTRDDLIKNGEQLLRLLSREPTLKMKDLAYTLNCTSSESHYKSAIIANSVKDLEKKLTYLMKRLADPQCTKIKDQSGIFFFEKPLAQEGTLAFLFPGEGSQYVNMLADLSLNFPEMRKCFDLADRAFLNSKRDILPSQVLFPPRHLQPASPVKLESELWRLDFAVAAAFYADYALFKLLSRLGIQPHVLVGHSSGEYTALLASGALDIQNEDEIISFNLDLFHLTPFVTEKIPVAKLITVGNIDPAVVSSLILENTESLYIAMDNCPHQVILCGTESAADNAINHLQNQGAICSLLPFNRPYHTPMYQSVCNRFFSLFQNRRIVPPHTTVYSCATTEPYPQDPLEIRRIASEQWAQPVRFRETIESLYDAGVRIFVEVGPRRNLTSFVDDILKNRQYVAVPSNVPHTPGITQLNYMIGLLAAHGVNMHLDYLYSRREPQRISFEVEEEHTTTSVKKQGTIELTLELPVLQMQNTGKSSISADTPVFPVTSSNQTDVKHHVQNKIPLQEENSHHQKDDKKQLHDKDINTSPSFDFSPITDHLSSMQSMQGMHFRPYDSFRPKIMQEYLQTMDQFLFIQQEIMSKFIAKNSALFDVRLSTSYPELISCLPSSLGFQCCRISENECKSQIQTLARNILNQQELETWFHLTRIEKRRTEWLLGRLVAKDAVRLFLRNRYQRKVSPSDIEIAADENGRPVVKGKFIEMLGCHISLSITHSAGSAVAVAGERNGYLGVGVDMERTNQNHKELERIIFSAEEEAKLAPVFQLKKEEWMLRLWCAKEAVAKAFGKGMIGFPNNLVIQKLEEETGRVFLSLAGELANQFPAYRGMSFIAYTRYENDFAFAISLV